MVSLVQTAPPQRATIEYPDTDGKSMAESDFQRKPLMYAVEVLSSHFEDRPDVYVSGNLLLYYEEGNPYASLAPDVFVVIGAEKRDRSSYKLWEEPKAPDFVLEITSKSTISEDQGSKRGLYAFMGVAEYFQYDPTADYLDPPLQGEKLVGRNYVALPVRRLPDGTLTLYSERLNLELQLRPDGLRFYDPETERFLLSYAEEKARANREAEARHLAEARVAELEARLRDLEQE
jgi:Uma2 family endonuclease